MDAITTHLVPLGFELPQPNRDVVGGYFVWLALPHGLQADHLAKRCQEDENLIVAPGGIFEVPGDEAVRFEHSVRLCFAWEDVPSLREGVRRIGAVSRRLLQSASQHTVESASMNETRANAVNLEEFK